MRLQSHIWVSAFLRAENAAGGFAVVQRRGASEAGAIFVVQDHRDGTLTVFGPAPQSMLDEDANRNFERVLDRVEEARVRDYLERQSRFDSDCWILETERRDGDPVNVS